MSEKFKYAPGRPGFGTKGNDGSVGSQGLAMYFTDFDPVSDTTLINSRIANDFALWSANPPVSLPGGRVYVTGDLFFDSEGKAYEINAETDTYEYKFASLNMGGFFVPLGISSDQNYARYFNSNTSPKYIIDNVYTMSGGINYSQVPSNIYGIEPKNFARIEYSNIQFGNYIPFTVYTSGQTAISDDEKALAIVNDPSNNAFRIGNLDNGGRLRNVNLIFDVSSLVQTKNGNNTVTPSSPTGTVLTNYEIAANCLFDDNFNPNPSSFAGVYGSAGDGSIRWNLRDFTDDPDVTGTLYVYTNANPYNGQLIRFDSSLMRPLIFNNIDASGSIRLAGLTIPNVYSYYISINKNGWTRNSDIQSITGASLTVSPTTYASSSTGYEASVGFDVDSNVIWSYTIIPNPSNLIYNIRSASTGGLDGSIWFDVSVNSGIDKTFIMRVTPYSGAYKDVSIYKPGSLVTAWVDISLGYLYDNTYSWYSYERQDASLWINNLPVGTYTDASVDLALRVWNNNSNMESLYVSSNITISTKGGLVLYSKSFGYFAPNATYDASYWTINLTNVSTGSLPLLIRNISEIQFYSDPGMYYAESELQASNFNFKYKSGPSVYLQNTYESVNTFASITMAAITKILKAIWSFLNSKLLGYAIALILVIWIAQMCSSIRDLKEEINNANQNNSALVDTLKKERLKTGELQYSIDGFVADLETLKKLNKDLATEVEKQKGKVISLNRIIILLRQDTTDLNKYIDSLRTVLEEPIKLNDTTYLVPWTLAYTYDSTNYDIFKGETRIGLTTDRFYKLTPGVLNQQMDWNLITVNHEGTRMLSRVTQIELVWGQKWEKGHLRVFANSKYPGFNVTNMEGVLLDVPKRSHWFTGFSVNVGIMPTYDFIQKKPTIVIGPSFGYTIYSF